MEQEDKVTMFIRKDSAHEFPIERMDEEIPETWSIPQLKGKNSRIAEKSQSLSPKKCRGKKIDKPKSFKLIF